ncbi:hypothetical protein EW146_g8482 [Bondarzewia mesenterica]|uniref:Inositol polyphosphate-related phosphatase domain-containing protein n=1 Tax=Bondarzewia mesenterica TaxID=1095465 RepID=A0A4S4LEI4_9AGAM|nr:hypothetical protein EW146_g8482 [Bondarzewia mesenterica]
MIPSSDIDTDAQPAVKNIRSRFEQLALDKAPSPLHSPNGHQDLLTADGYGSRPRAVSNPKEQPNPFRHVRSSSSSDLKGASKKAPPPPPPPRGMKPAPSPSASPLLRPVQAQVLTSGYTSDVSMSSQSSLKRLADRRPPPIPAINLDGDGKEVAPAGGVATLVNMFAVRAQVPKPCDLTSVSVASNHAPPAVPPRPLKSPSPHHPPPSPRASPIRLPQNPLVEISPFSDEESDSETVSAQAPSSNGTIYYQKHTHPRQESISSIDSSDALSSSSSLVSDQNSNTKDVFTTPPRPIPPRPPPRKGMTLLNPVSVVEPPVPLIDINTPPPLPNRRPTIATERPTQGIEHVPSPILERKPLGNHKLPPPPVRIIALGDKLPPARRMVSESSDESEEEDPKSKLADSMPDTSHSYRRPPTIAVHQCTGSDIHIMGKGATAVAGHVVVVASAHHVKVFDLSVSESPMFNFDGKDVGLTKELKVTSMEWRAAVANADRGMFIWLGTKDGHLFELDVKSGTLVGLKLAAHAHPVTHILRYGSSMVTLDDNGKVLVFTAESGEDPRLAYGQPRVVRIADQQQFVRIFDGKLWTSAKEPSTAGASRAPIVRVYDIFTAGSQGRSLLPTEHIGAVLTGTVIPSLPEKVYLGHEGGHVSIWSIATPDGVPVCIEVIKVSASDIVCLEGVNDRLWAGGRNGVLAAYDVVPRPWIMTNSWDAHGGTPVLEIKVDPYSIDLLGRLCVVSTGRDEKLKFWDGLLGTDWIDNSLLKREKEFSTFRNLNVLIVSWNVDASKPDALMGSPDNLNFLSDVLKALDSPDIISFGWQEVIDLESRKMAAKSVLMGKKKGADSGISEKVSSSYKRWHDRLVLAVRLAMPPDTPYTVIHTENLVGLFSCIFVKQKERVSLRHVAVATVKRGMGGRYGNKGGIVARMVIDDSSICFINCHLAAGQAHVRQRNGDVAAMLEEKSVLPSTEFFEESLSYVGGGDGSMVLDHEIVFVNGDMNYRIDQRRDVVAAAVKANNYLGLLVHDQLMKEMKFNPGFRFRSFTEGPIIFPPTYKYDPRTSEYDSSEKRRIPAWCDRVLWRARDPSRVQQLHYRRYEADISDHRPVSAGFRMTVKSVKHDARAGVKAEVEAVWHEHERRLLAAVRTFYVQQMII